MALSEPPARHGSKTRYPGSPPFEDTELDRRLFFGRERDSVTVLHSILSHDLFVLYARSGVGKTSLLKAGVMQELRQRDLCPVTIRLSDTSTRPLDLVRAALLELNESGDLEVLGADAAAGNLVELMAGLEIWRDDTLQLPVLIFDQFEELFTLWDAARRHEFIADFAELVRPTSRAGTGGDGPVATDLRPRVKVVLALREDFLGHLESFATDIPLILAHRYRLQPLTRDQAREAIEAPARLLDEGMASDPFEYEQEAIDSILDFLTATPDGNGSGESVESFQLQIVCRYIEDQVLQRRGQPVSVRVDDFGGAHGLNTIFSEFYQREVADLGSRREQRKVRDFCETKLISPTGRRISLEREQIVSGHGVSEEQLETLVRRRVVRAEPRLQTFYYELAHDSLVQPILDDRSARIQRNRVRGVFIAAALAAVAIMVLGIIALTRGGDGGGGGGGDTGPAIVSVDGSPVPGSLDAKDEIDVFEITSDEGDVLLFTVEPTGSSSVDVQIVEGDDFTPLDRSVDPDGGRAELTVSSRNGGTNNVTVRSPSGATGEYEVGVTAVKVWHADDDRKPDINEPGDIDIIRLPGDIGEALSLAVAPNDSFNATVSLVDQSGDILGSSDELGRATNNVLIRTLEGVGTTEEATYFAVVRHATEEPRPYTLEVERSTVSDLESAQVGPEDEPGELDVFRFEPDVKQAAVIRLQPETEGSLVGGTIEILDAESRLVARTDREQTDATTLLTVPILAAGPHTVVVDRSPDDANYSIGVDFVDAVSLVDDTPTDERPTGDRAAYFFPGEAGTLVTIDLTPTTGALDAVLELVGPDLTVIERVDVRGTGAPETTTVLLPSTGTYVVRATARGADGAYTLRLSKQTPAPLPDDEPLDSSISTPSDVATYAFQAAAGEAVTLTLTSPESDDFSGANSFNGVMEVIDSRSERVAFADLGGVGATETITMIPRRAGTFVVFVRGFRDSTGEFSISLQRPDVQPLTFGSEEGGEIAVGDTGTDVDVFSFSASSGQALTLTMDVDSTLDGQFELVDSESQSITLVDYERAGGSETITLTIPNDGQYFVLASGVNQSSGGYQMNLGRPEPTVLVSGGRESGSIEAGAVDAYLFNGAADEAATLTLTSGNGLDGVLEIWDPSSERIARVDIASTDGVDSMTIVLERGGAYVVTVRGYDESAGDYDLDLRLVQTIVVDGNIPYSGAIENPGDVDVLRFSATSRQTLSLQMLPAETLAGSFRLVSPDGIDTAVGGVLGDSPLLVTAAQAGEYQVFVGGAGGTTGDYTFAVTLTAS